MPKNILQDVVPRGGRRSIRDIPLPRKNEENPTKRGVDREGDFQNESEAFLEVGYGRSEEETVNQNGGRGFGFSRWFIWLVGLLAAGALIVTVSDMFYGAVITVTPKSKVTEVNVDFTAKPKAPSGELSYSPFSTVLEKEISVSADSEKQVENRASGKIIIYNNYSATNQRLVKNTRFETPDGLIYKISDSVTLPGRKTINGKTLPGSIEALVYAESAGEEYNIGLTDFTIPGFKSNSERFAKFYARSKTLMTGGKIGLQKTVSDEKTLQTQAALQSELTKELLDEARSRVETDSIFYDGAYMISFEPVPVVGPNNKGDIAIRLRARFSAFFIKNNGDLAKAVAEYSVPNFDGAPVYLQNAKDLNFKLLDKENYKPGSVGPIRFTLKGTSTVVWLVDKEKLVGNLAAKNKNALSDIAKSDPAILKAAAVIRPFWKNDFPKLPKDIEVKIDIGPIH